MKRDIWTFARALICVLVVDACGGTLGGNPSVNNNGNPSNPGTVPAALTFSITDAPIEDAQSVYITIASLKVAQSDSEGAWITVPLKVNAEIDLLALQGGSSSVLAAMETLPNGTYTHTRLALTSGRLVDKNGVSHVLEMPNGNDSGLKIQTSFALVEGKPLELTIDFDLRKSLKSPVNGQYSLKPALRMTDDSISGSVSGTAATGSIICVYGQDETRDVTDSCDNAVTSAVVKDGKYKIAFLNAGSYDLRVFKGGAFVKDIDGVVISSGKETEDQDDEDNTDDEQD